MSMFIYVVTDIIHIIKIVLLCEMFFMFEKRANEYIKSAYAISLAIMSIISIGLYMSNDDAIRVVVYTISIIVLICIMYQERLLNKIFSAIWIIFIVTMLDTMSMVLIEMICGLIGQDYDSVSKMVAGLVSVAIVAIVGCIYYSNYKDGIKEIGIGKLSLFTILALADTFVVMVMAGITKNENQGQYKVIYSIAFAIVIVGIFIQLATVILLFMQRNLYKEKKQITEKYLNEQISHYEYLEQREIETKRFRHDLRNHMQMLSNLAHNGQHKKIDDYLDAMNVKIESFGNVITVQNGIADAIINQSYSRAEQDGIKMDIKGRFPRECAVEAYDLCTILSNVLNNALEAAVKSNEKRISIDCRYNDKNIILVVKNTYKDVGQFENDKFKTSKEDMDYHGYGLINIRESLNKYNGVLDVETDGEVFTLKISLNYTEKREYEDSGHR